MSQADIHGIICGMSVKRLSIVLILSSLALLVMLSSCDFPGPNPEGRTPDPQPSVTLAIIFTPTPSLIPATATPTPEPLAARVNGEGILLRDFNAELDRYKQAGASLAEQAGQTPEEFVLSALIDERLLAQAAAAQAYVPGEAEIQARLDSLAAQMDLQNWMVSQGYDETSLRLALGRAMQASWMRDHIAADVSATAEQVHAVQILLYNSSDAAEAYSLALSTDDFLALARDYNAITGGEMGWFARGSLFYPALEEVAFTLQPGSFSQVIQTPLGYHILYVVEREADRRLDPEALRALQSAAVAEWLSAQKISAAIEIMIGQATP